MDFLQGAGRRGVVVAKVRVKGSVTAGDGLAVDGHASTSLEISSRSAVTVWGWRIGKQQSCCVGRGELLPGFVVGGAFVSVVWVFWWRLLWVGTALEAGYKPGSFSLGCWLNLEPS